jgi:hypothetical protein
MEINIDPLGMSTTRSPYGFNFFDRPTDFLEEEEDEDEYGENSCPSGCCDHDCECDDCLRCSHGESPVEPDSHSDEFSVAAA